MADLKAGHFNQMNQTATETIEQGLADKVKLMRDIAANSNPEPHDTAEHTRQLNELNGFDVVEYLREHDYAPSRATIG